jgi:CRISPR/Cas system-associated exonuclease Cas4 (RecB family)
MKIRYNLDFIPVSSIAEQWYCEKALDLQYQHPNVVFKLPGLDFGTVEHELISREAEPITKEELKKYIEDGRLLRLQETMFEGTYGNVLIRGIPDYVEIKDGKANFLGEFKFSKKKRIFKTHRIQLDTYGYLLYKNKIDIKNLFCGIAIFPLNELNQDEAINEVIKKMKRRLATIRNKRLDKLFFDEPGSFGGYLYPFSLNEAKSNLKWAMEYWLKKREPVPTKKAYKCKACPYNVAGFCKVALAEADKHRVKIKKKKDNSPR